ncbi:hypothetical protein INR49_032758, partial [Caranx melampygus]
VQIMPAGGETTLFKHFFFNWLDKDETTGPSKAYTIGRIAQVEQIPFDSSTLHSNKIMAAQHGMIWRVEGGDKVPVDPSTYGQFFGGDCYLVLYSYNAGGRMSTSSTPDAAVFSIGSCHSGQEPAHLVSLFKDKPLVVHLGGTCRHCGDTKPASTRLFHIRQSSTKATRAVEVVPTASSLNTNDIFVLKSPSSLVLWVGKGANPEEMAAAKYVASLLGGPATHGRDQGARTLQKTLRAPRLFGCSNKTGRLIAEEVPGEFTQLDLASDDVMILDTWDQIFVWVGEEANEVEKSGSLKIAQDYVNSDPSGRRGTPITTIKQKEEPLSFTGWFHAWDPKMWDKDFKQRMQDHIKKHHYGMLVTKSTMNQKVVLITGCSSGIGLALAVRIAKDEKKRFMVYATMRNLSKGGPLVEAAGRTLGRTLEIKQLDVCDENSIKACVDSLPERRVDILISNAGMGLIGPIECQSIDEMRNVMDTNFFGLVRLLKEILPDMKKRKKGHIVVISSVMGIQGILFNDVYAASKFAVEGFCESLAVQALRFNLNISLIEPGPVITEFERKVYEEGLKTDLSKADKVTADMFTNIYLKNYKQIFETLGQSPEDVAEHTFKIITMDNPPFRHQTNTLYTPMTTLKYADPNGDLPIDTFYKWCLSMTRSSTLV